MPDTTKTVTISIEEYETLKAENARLNHLEDRVRFVEANAFDLLAQQSREGVKYDVVILDPEKEVTVDASRFKSKGHNTPFDGRTYCGAVCATLVGGRVIDEEGL